MNRRSLGCGVLAIVVFLGIGVLGLSLATTRAGCPKGLQWEAQGYVLEGTPAPSPFAGSEAIGSTFIGLTTRRAFAAPSGDARPIRVALECGDGTYQTYRQAP
ncbi:MAG: hypothetical protein M3R05_06675 [Chloroflexota bacterium]|nr:hypothetical protein [Chloroflexota bacterium]